MWYENINTKEPSLCVLKRPYNNSILMQKMIIKYGKMCKDPFGYIFYANGGFNGKRSTWRLGVNISKKLVWHFGHNF